MKYIDFENIMSTVRMNRYLIATGNDSRKAMTLYRKNLKLSQEMFTIISCFEVALRKKLMTSILLNTVIIGLEIVFLSEDFLIRPIV